MSIGIYKLTNKINGKCYIGQSVNIERRLSTHFWAAYLEIKEMAQDGYTAIEIAKI